MRQKYSIEPIGIIRSPYKTKDQCPIQGRVKPDSLGQIEIFPEYQDGLETIETFSHIFMCYIFDQAGEIILCRPSFLDDSPHGIFASRHPCRPNGIGFSIVALQEITGSTLIVKGIDVLDGTPLIDIKPYVPKFDYFENANNGWIDSVAVRPKPPNRE
jgi:tRNA-Thr(GGU) m(6)t(6)A37 methyltransferase TsaA